MAAALARASQALSRGDFPAAVVAFNEAAASRDARIAVPAWHSLGALHHGASGDARVPLDVRASASAYAKCVQALIADPAQARQQELLKLFVDAVHACGMALTEELPLDSAESEAALAALKAVCRACDGDAPKIPSAEAAVFGWFGRAQLAFEHRSDRSEAARCQRHTVAAGLRLKPGCDPRAREEADTARRNLAVLEARSDLERERANREVRAAVPDTTRLFTAVRTSDTVAPVPRDCCAACGASPLVLKKCGGSCGGAVRYCGAACFAAHVRQHMSESGCKKRKT